MPFHGSVGGGMTIAAASPVPAFPLVLFCLVLFCLVLFCLVLFCFSFHTRGIPYTKPWPLPCPWTRGQFSARFIAIVTCHNEFSPNTLLCRVLLLSFRCHHPLVLGTEIMRQVKGRAEIQRVKKGVKYGAYTSQKE